MIDLTTMITGGVYRYRLPGRGITVKREFEPIMQIAERSLKVTADLITDTIYAMSKAINDQLTLVLKWSIIQLTK